MAIILPIVALVLVVIVQAGLVMRDRVVVVHAARAAARAVAVDPTPRAAQRALADQGDVGVDPTITLGGDLSPGGLASVTVEARPTALPLVGRAVSGIVLRQRFAVRVEGP